jgi:hypothetical protein
MVSSKYMIAVRGEVEKHVEFKKLIGAIYP